MSQSRPKPNHVLAKKVVPIDVERFARYLAWSDHAMAATSSPSRFEERSALYWEQAGPAHRGNWLGLAASLLGVAASRERSAGGRGMHKRKVDYAKRIKPIVSVGSVKSVAGDCRSAQIGARHDR